MVIHGDDLVVATHGRSFWILDDITPLRQARGSGPSQWRAVALSACSRRSRRQHGFLCTPLPPEEPTAENPPSGAVIDYFLKSSAGQVKIEIVDGAGTTVRRFSTNDKSEPKRQPGAVADRWFPKPEFLERAPGMHRFVWNLAWGVPVNPDGEEEEEYGAPRGPRAVPGNYELRLTVDGKAWTQPLKVTMDPRSPATAQDLEQQLAVGRQIFAEVLQCRRILGEVNAAQKQLTDVQSKASETADLKAGLAEAVTELKKILAGSAETGGVTGLQMAGTGLSSALRVVESGDRTVPEQANEIYRESSAAMKLGLEAWSQFKATRLPQLNRLLQQANLPPITIAAGSTQTETNFGELQND